MTAAIDFQNERAARLGAGEDAALEAAMRDPSGRCGLTRETEALARERQAIEASLARIYRLMTPRETNEARLAAAFSALHDFVGAANEDVIRRAIDRARARLDVNDPSLGAAS